MPPEAFEPLSANILASYVREVRDRYVAEGLSLYDIGNGWCEEFTDDVIDLWIGDGWQRLEGRDGRGWETMETAQLIGDDGWDDEVLARIGVARPADVSGETFAAVAAEEPAHVWIAFEGRHYDAEHPEGVDSPFDLNFFRRWMDRPVLSDAETDAPAPA